MNDWSAEVTGTYGLQVENLRKGRGAWILETDGGLKLLKEYKGSVKRLEFEEQVLAAVNGQSGLKVDQYQRNLEGGLLSVAEDGTKYIVKDWFFRPGMQFKGHAGGSFCCPPDGHAPPAVSERLP